MKTNNNFMHAIDMGLSVNWADRNLILNNFGIDVTEFNYSDACKYQDSTWRLPTVNEMCELLSLGFKINNNNKNQMIGLSVYNNNKNVYFNFTNNAFYILKDTEGENCYAIYGVNNGFIIVKQPKTYKGKVIYVSPKPHDGYCKTVSETTTYFDGTITSTNPFKLEDKCKTNTIPVDSFSIISLDSDDVVAKSKYWEQSWYKEGMKSMNKELAEKEEKVNHPKHYMWFKEKFGIEPYEILQEMPYNIGVAMKYLIRQGKKTELGYKDTEKQIEDLKKAITYLQFEIERLEK